MTKSPDAENAKPRDSVNWQLGISSIGCHCNCRSNFNKNGDGTNCSSEDTPAL
jgi:hypothetical protein